MVSISRGTKSAISSVPTAAETFPGSAQRTIGYHTTEPTSHEDAEYQKGQIALMDKVCVGIAPVLVGMIAVMNH